MYTVLMHSNSVKPNEIGIINYLEFTVEETERYSGYEISQGSQRCNWQSRDLNPGTMALCLLSPVMLMLSHFHNPDLLS